MRLILPAMISLLFSVTACSPTPVENGDTQDQPAQETQIDPDLTDADLSEADLTEIGLLTSVEDGAYPFYSITLEFPKKQSFESFTLNAEEVAVDMDKLNAVIGTNIPIEYTSDLRRDVVEIEVESKFLLGSEDRQALQAYDKITGLMGGAEITMGDIPTEFYVQDSAGDKTYFQESINSDMMAVNGRDVTIYFDTRVQDVITRIKLD